jgi:hypothetical protein
MMANWELEPLMRDLPKLTTRLDLIVGEADSAVPPDDAERVKERLPTTQVTRVPKLGHLAHEEDPSTFADLIFRIADELTLSPTARPLPLPIGEWSASDASRVRGRPLRDHDFPPHPTPAASTSPPRGEVTARPELRSASSVASGGRISQQGR